MRWLAKGVLIIGVARAALIAALGAAVGAGLVSPDVHEAVVKLFGS